MSRARARTRRSPPQFNNARAHLDRKDAAILAAMKRLDQYLALGLYLAPDLAFLLLAVCRVDVRDGQAEHFLLRIAKVVAALGIHADNASGHLQQVECIAGLFEDCSKTVLAVAQRRLRGRTLGDFATKLLVDPRQLGRALGHELLELLAVPQQFLLSPPPLGDVLEHHDAGNDVAAGIANRSAVDLQEHAGAIGAANLHVVHGRCMAMQAGDNRHLRRRVKLIRACHICLVDEVQLIANRLGRDSPAEQLLRPAVGQDGPAARRFDHEHAGGHVVEHGLKHAPLVLQRIQCSAHLQAGRRAGRALLVELGILRRHWQSITIPAPTPSHDHARPGRPPKLA